MFSTRYWLYGVLLSSQNFFSSPTRVQIKPDTTFSVVHSSTFVLRALTVKPPGCLLLCIRPSRIVIADSHSRRSLLKVSAQLFARHDVLDIMYPWY